MRLTPVYAPAGHGPHLERHFVRAVLGLVALIQCAVIQAGCGSNDGAGSGGSGGQGGNSGDAGDAGNPLVGTWSENVTVNGVSETLTFTFDSDGAFSTTETAPGACQGRLSFSGASWTSTPTAVTLRGKPTCAGKLLLCFLKGKEFVVDCPSTAFPDATCNYTLSRENETLTLRGCPSAFDVSLDTFVLARTQ